MGKSKGIGGVGVLVLVCLGLWAWSKRKPAMAAVIKPEVKAKQQAQIAEAVTAGATVLKKDGEAVGWIEQTAMGPVPIIPWGATPEQEQAAIEAFDKTLVTTEELAPVPAAEVTPLAAEPTPPPVPIEPEKVVTAVEQATVPEGFTASAPQLDTLEEAGYTKDTQVYQEAIDLAYVEAASQASEGDIISWSAEGGYEAVSVEQAIAAQAASLSYY